MIEINDTVVFDKILAHIDEERIKASLNDKPFDLGIVTDKRPSHVLDLIEGNMEALKEIGMSSCIWHHDALRSSMKLAGEDLLFSICAPRD